MSGLELMGSGRERRGCDAAIDGVRAGAGRRLPAVRLRHRRRARAHRLGRQHRRRRGRRGRGRPGRGRRRSAAGCATDAPPLAVVERRDESRARPSRRHRLHHRGVQRRGAGPHAGLARRRDLRRLPAPSCATRPTAATGTRSSPAPTAARGSRSSPACPTTGAATTMAGFAMCARLPRRVRRPGRPALPRPADRLPRLRAAARTASRGHGPTAARRRTRCAPPATLLARGPDRRGQGPRRLPPGLRRPQRGGGRRAAPAQAAAAASRSR